MTTPRLLSPEELIEITGKTRYTAQAEWFRRELGVEPMRGAGGRLIVTWATFEALSAKKNGLSVGVEDAGKVELCFD